MARGAHLDKTQGNAEEQSKPYGEYGERVPEAATQRFAKNSSGAASSAGRQAGVVRASGMRFRRTSLIAVGCASALAGIGLSRKFNADDAFLAALISAAGLLLLRPKNITGLLLVILLGLGLGFWRGGAYMQKLQVLKNYTTQKVVIEATATSDSIYTTNSQIEFTASSVRLLNPQNQSLAGSFKISGFGVPMIYRGDRVQVAGKLFPTRGSNQARIAYAQLQKIGLDNSWVNRFTRRFSAGMQSALPEPQASFGLGLLIGQRSTLPTEILNMLTIVGLVHIVAVSGYNLTILVRAAGRLKLGSKYQQLLLSLALIGFFLLMTGFSASIVRAALVSLLSLWAWFYGRKIRPIVLIALAAAITGLANPFYVWGDLGWYLSFLAFFGILMIAPQISARLFKKEPKVLGGVVIETFAAEIMTLPLIMLAFGQLSAVALLANVLVVPFVPFAMLLSTLAAGAGMLVPALAGWIAWPANLLLTFMLDIVRLMASVPSALLLQSISVDIMLSFYFLVLLGLLVLHRRQTKTDIITDVNNTATSSLRLDAAQGRSE